jgi:hypothetical protein
MVVVGRPAARSTVARLTLAVLIGTMWGCASSAPAPSARPSGRALDGVRRIVVVSSADSRFSTVQTGATRAGAVDEVMKWLPYIPSKWALIAGLVYKGVASFIDRPVSSGAPPGVTPGSVVADEFVRTLRSSRPFAEVVPLDREPTGDARRDTDAILRVTVPSWGLVRVREGNPQLVAGFADVRAQMVLPESGVVVWEHEEDVTHPERLPLEVVTRDRALSHEQLVHVMERAGRRLANELVYARGGGG